MHCFDDVVEPDFLQVLDHVTDRFHVEFLQDAVDLGFDRSLGHIAGFGNLPGVHALVEAFQYFEFTVGQHGENVQSVEQAVLLLPYPFQLLDDFLRVFGPEDHLVLEGVPDGGQDLVDGVGFDDIVRNAGAVGLEKQVVILEDGQDNDLGSGRCRRSGFPSGCPSG